MSASERFKRKPSDVVDTGVQVIHSEAGGGYTRLKGRLASSIDNVDKTVGMMGLISRAALVFAVAGLYGSSKGKKIPKEQIEKRKATLQRESDARVAAGKREKEKIREGRAARQARQASSASKEQLSARQQRALRLQAGGATRAAEVARQQREAARQQGQK